MARKSLPAASAPAEVPAESTQLSRKEQALLQEHRQQAASVLAAAGLAVEYSFESFVEIIKSSAIQCARSSLVLGSALLAVRANEPASRFQFVLEQIGLGEDSAMSAMALAKHVARSPAHLKVYDTLGSTKALALFRNITDDDVKALAHDEEQLAETAGKSVRQLAAELKALREEAKADAEAKARILARKDKKINELQEQLERRGGAPDQIQLQAGEMMIELGNAVAEALRTITEVERVMSDIRSIHSQAGETLSAALHEQMHGQAMLVAKRVGALTSFGAGKK